MGTRFHKPNTPGMRGKVSLSYEEVSGVKPTKSLVKGKASISCRDGGGRISGSASRRRREAAVSSD